MSFSELEYKYRADEVGLTEFRNLMESVGYEKQLDVSSWDTYYTTPNDNDKFQRFRNGVTTELTKKVKTVDANNWHRVEVDLPLDTNRITEEIVTKYVSIDGYSENFRIWKNCFIYWLPNINFVYYIVYDKNLRETGRFIEVEVNKDRVTGLPSATDTLNEAEKLLEKLGISYKNRLKKSLFELYRK